MFGCGGDTVFMTSFPKTQERLFPYVFSDRRGYKKESDKSQFASSPSNCFLSNHVVNNAKQSQKEQNYFLPAKGLLQKGQRVITRKRNFSSLIRE